MTTPLLLILWTHIQANLTRLREHNDDGYTAETVLVTAILAALALIVIGTIIYNKVVGKANGISLG